NVCLPRSEYFNFGIPRGHSSSCRGDIHHLDWTARMNSPLRAGANLPDAAWKRLRLRAIFDHCKWDPQCGDHAVLAKFPLLLDFGSVRELSLLAERLTLEALAAETEILQKPWLLKRLAIPRHIRKELQRDVPDRQPQHVRVMRFDFHFTTQGWQIS